MISPVENVYFVHTPRLPYVDIPSTIPDYELRIAPKQVLCALCDLLWWRRDSFPGTLFLTSMNFNLIMGK